MADDYSYKSQNLLGKESWPYALGSNNNINGLVGIGRSDLSVGEGANTGSPSLVNNYTTVIEGPYIPEPPGGGTYVLGSIGGSVAWIDTTDCES